MSDLLNCSTLSDVDDSAGVSLSAHGATPEVMAAFFRVSTEMTCGRDKVLFRQGDPPRHVHLVVSGEVILTMPVSRVREVTFRATAGVIVGLPAFFSNAPYSLTAVARGGTHLARMTREQFAAMLVANPALSIDLLRVLADETRGARNAIASLSAGQS